MAGMIPFKFVNNKSYLIQAAMIVQKSACPSQVRLSLGALNCWRKPGQPVLISNCRFFNQCCRHRQIEVRKRGTDLPTTGKEKVKQAAKDTSYAIVIVAGIACMGFVFYVLYRELLSKAGPTQVFGDALEKCRSDQQLSVALGSPIEGYGETNSRGRRRHVSHLAYIDAHGRDAMRMKFYVKGSSGRTGTVQVDSVLSRGKIGYRYIIAYLDTYPRRTIVVMDDRSAYDKEGEILNSHEL